MLNTRNTKWGKENMNKEGKGCYKQGKQGLISIRKARVDINKESKDWYQQGKQGLISTRIARVDMQEVTIRKGVKQEFISN